MEADVNVILTSMLLSIDSFQNRVSTNQYDMSVLQAQVYSIEMMFFSFSTEQLFVFNNNDCTLRSIF